MMTQPAHLTEQAYRARVLQFLAWLTFPATTRQVLDQLQQRNTPMELLEDTLVLPDQSFASAEAVADAVVAVHRRRLPHTWTSRVILE